MGHQAAPLPGNIKSGCGMYLQQNKYMKYQTSGFATDMHPDLLEYWGFCQCRGTIKSSLISAADAVECIKDMPQMREYFKGNGAEELVVRSFRLEPRELKHLFYGRA